MKERLTLEYLISSLSVDMRSACLKLPDFAVERRPEAIWKQKVFCVLSSQFNAKRAADITDLIVQSVPFFDYALPIRAIEAACFEFLSGRGIGHRFPRTRARQIALCWFPFSQIKDEYQEFIRSCGSEDRARDEIVEVFPGIGLKQASMFLRNIGASKTLSVIDIHTMFYLRTCHGMEIDHLSAKQYLRAEETLRRAASEHDLELNVFDVIVWSSVRAIKRAYRNV